LDRAVQRLFPGPSAKVDWADLPDAYAYPPGDATTVRANMVASVDGAAQLGGRSGPLSTPADQKLLGLLRQLADVVLVGARTARAERYGPVPVRRAYEDLRLAAGQLPAPPIAVVSGGLDLDPDGPLFRDAAAQTIVVTCRAAPPDRRRLLSERAEVIDAGDDRVDLGRAVDALAERGHRRVLCEGGPTVLAQLTRTGRLDELCLTVSPLLTGGSAARILDGTTIEPAMHVRLLHLLEDDGALFARYATSSRAAG
jgi:riboflavin biosynthesis pyrimidine reductase